MHLTVGAGVVDGRVENPLAFSIIRKSHCWEFSRSVYHQRLPNIFQHEAFSLFLIPLSCLAWRCDLLGELEKSARTRIIIMWTEMW